MMNLVDGLERFVSILGMPSNLASGSIVFKISTVRFSAVSSSIHDLEYGQSLTMEVSQFTLLASTKKGSKPDFHGALGGDQARELYQHFVSKVQQGYQADRVKDGVFQAMMVR